MVAPNDPSHPQRPVSARKLRANRRNARQSTGPRTPDGKARASRNATTHGIFCRDLVLAGEDSAHFHLTRDGFIDALRPQDAAQLAVVDIAVSARWRMNRCQRAEAELIEQRIAHSSAQVTKEFESLQRQMRFEDFSAAAIDAQCAQSESFRRHFERWKTLRARRAQAMHPGHAMAAIMLDATRGGDAALERLGRYAHRLEQSFHRCLRDLHVLKQKAKQYADEPLSPFRSQIVDAETEGEAAEEAPARGMGAPPMQQSRSDESADCSAATHGQGAHATSEPPAQNEPTAEQSAASTGPADTSGAPASPPDPQEMAALRKFTDLLSRCRRRADPEEGFDDDMS